MLDGISPDLDKVCPKPFGQKPTVEFSESPERTQNFCVHLLYLFVSHFASPDDLKAENDSFHR